MSARAWFERRVNGYMHLTNAYLDGTLDPWTFRCAVVSLWGADVHAYYKLEVLQPLPPADRVKGLLDRIARREIDEGTFVIEWTSLWQFFPSENTHSPLDAKVEEILNKLHTDVYHFTSNQQDLEEDPEFFISESSMRKLALEDRDALMRLLEQLQAERASTPQT